MTQENDDGYQPIFVFMRTFVLAGLVVNTHICEENYAPLREGPLLPLSGVLRAFKPFQ